MAGWPGSTSTGWLAAMGVGSVLAGIAVGVLGIAVVAGLAVPAAAVSGAGLLVLGGGLVIKGTAQLILSRKMGGR